MENGLATEQTQDEWRWKFNGVIIRIWHLQNNISTASQTPAQSMTHTFFII